MSAPLKPNLKFDNFGLGHDKAASDFNNHWWERVYNDAATNVVVDNKKTKIAMRVKDSNSVEITTNSYSMQKFKELNKNSGHGYNNFMKVSTLTAGQTSDSYDENQMRSIEISKTKPLTDDELFKACGGRTAHKGARHGLKMSGKLARLAEQERHLLDSLKAKTETECPTSIFKDWTTVKSKKNNKRLKSDAHLRTPVTTPDDEECESLKGILDNDSDYILPQTSKKSQKFKRKVEIEMSETLSSALTLDSKNSSKKVTFQTTPTTINPSTSSDHSSADKSEKHKSTKKVNKRKKKLREKYEEDEKFQKLLLEKRSSEETKKPRKRKADEAQLDKKVQTPVRSMKSYTKFVSEDEESEDGHTTDSSTGGLRPRKTRMDNIPVADNAYANLTIEDDEHAKEKRREKRKRQKQRKFEKNNTEKNVKFPIMKTIKKDMSRKSKKKLRRSVTKLSSTIENFFLSSHSEGPDGDVEIK